MSTVLDERARRQARSRAKAATILDAPRVIRRFVAVDTDLRASTRRRSTRTADDTPVEHRPKPQRGDGGGGHGRRTVAVAVLVVQLVLLGAALFLPTFRVTAVQVTGTSLLTNDAVIKASGLSDARSIFTVDGDAVRSKLVALGWVRTATVETELPNIVRIKVQEWPPIMTLRTNGKTLLVAASGASVSVDATKAGATNGIPLLVDDRPNGGPQRDAALAGGALTRMLAVTAQKYPAVFGCAVASFQWSTDGLFSINATTGWRAILGHLDDATAIAAVPEQLAALAALKGPLDFVHPKFGYVDLESPATPAVGGTPSAPVAAPAAAAPVAAAPAAKPAVPVKPAASSSAAPTPVPTPTPKPVRTFVLPPPPGQ